MSRPVLMDFYADWCGPCSVMEPIISELKARMGDSVDIKKIDVGTDSDEARHYATKYGIQYIPTIVIEKDDVLKEKLIGVQSLETLEATLRSLVD